MGVNIPRMRSVPGGQHATVCCHSNIVALKKMILNWCLSSFYGPNCTLASYQIQFFFFNLEYSVVVFHHNNQVKNIF